MDRETILKHTTSFKENLLRALADPEEAQAFLEVAFSNYKADNDIDALLLAVSDVSEAFMNVRPSGIVINGHEYEYTGLNRASIRIHWEKHIHDHKTLVCPDCKHDFLCPIRTIKLEEPTNEMINRVVSILFTCPRCSKKLDDTDDQPVRKYLVLELIRNYGVGEIQWGRLKIVEKTDENEGL